MILYPTKKTAEVFGAPMADSATDPVLTPVINAVLNAEKGNGLQEWGLKLFYLQGKKCLQAIHFASHFTVVLFDVRKADLPETANRIAMTVFDAFDGEPETQEALAGLFRKGPISVWDRLQNKSVLSSLNRNESMLLTNWGFYESFAAKGKLNPKEVHKFINFEYPVSLHFRGSSRYGYTGEVLRELAETV